MLFFPFNKQFCACCSSLLILSNSAAGLLVPYHKYVDCGYIDQKKNVALAAGAAAAESVVKTRSVVAVSRGGIPPSSSLPSELSTKLVALRSCHA